MLAWFSEMFNKFAKYLLMVLPISPFQPFIQKISGLQYLSWLNWFFPVKAILTVTAAWIAAIAIYYIWIIVARWVKLIE